MMNNKRKTKLDRLLTADDRIFSVQEKEQILRNLLTEHADNATIQTQPKTESFISSLTGRLMLYGLPVTAAASLVLLLWPTDLLRQQAASSTVDPQAFVSRGQNNANVETISSSMMLIRCLSQSQNTDQTKCTSGETLLTALRSDDDKVNVGLAALGPDGILSWYYPNANSQLYHLQPGQLSSLELPLQPNLPSGHYTLYAVLSAQVIKRADVRKAIEQSSNQNENRQTFNNKNMTLLLKHFVITKALEKP